MPTRDNDSRLQEAIELFNSQEYFACHDVLEDLWDETLTDERGFLQGLIHAAVALFHFTEGNLGGARKMHDSAVRYLSPFQPGCQGVELTQFLIRFDECFAPLLGHHKTYPQGIRIDESLIPQLMLTFKEDE
ncbi:DUF309 domain-containing protein [Thalassoglobus polymorphus]|uniref:DUF309 domain-containing protein n=1 Tax=Thalassoglobus polymorphus TaxID=2527994 RepID=A0A517QHD3_9PLAN|nr:DUF309 domain-containing protein [Thalassoglobus polymorphus]QDT31044.1 hypothetical protein Mal48_02740 [Thalassoglobus polymorphus]